MTKEEFKVNKLRMDKECPDAYTEEHYKAAAEIVNVHTPWVLGKEYICRICGKVVEDGLCG